jgi:hypothetical protein
MAVSPEARTLYRWRKANPYQGSRLHCAGCGQPLNGPAFEVGDGARVHPGDRLIDCLAEYGRRREDDFRVAAPSS